MKDTVYGLVSDDFDVDTLENLCVSGGIQTGPFGSQLHQKDYLPVGTPIITVEHLGENRVLHQDLPRVSDADKERLSRYVMEKGDIIFSRVGSVDRRALVRDEEDGWLFSGRCLRVRPDKAKIDSDYLSWFFGLEIFKDYIRRIAVGATMPSLNTELLSNVPVFFPPLPEQRAIAGILGALDDKIELNRRMNRTLESMARAVFRQWFVEDEEIGDWEIGKLGDVAENIRRSANADEIEPETHYIGLEHMPRGSIALSEWGNASELASNKFIFKEGEFLFGKLRPYFHKVGIAPIDGVCSTDILVIAPKSPEWYGFVLGHISSVELINYTNAASTGTKMPRTNWTDIAHYEVVIPPMKLAKDYNEIFLPMAQRIRANIKESRTLASLRDSLLPRLMRGEVRVK